MLECRLLTKLECLSLFNLLGGWRCWICYCIPAKKETGEAADGVWCGWVLIIHVGEPSGVPGSWLIQFSSRYVTHWRENRWMESLSLFLTESMCVCVCVYLQSLMSSVAVCSALSSSWFLSLTHYFFFLVLLFPSYCLWPDMLSPTLLESNWRSTPTGGKVKCRDVMTERSQRSTGPPHQLSGPGLMVAQPVTLSHSLPWWRNEHVLLDYPLGKGDLLIWNVLLFNF